MIAYATSEVAQGRKIIVRKSPLNLRSLLFSIDARISAKINITGT